MQRLLAIAGLTWKAAFRFRLFVIVAGLLLVAVVGLPALVKDDGTVQGFTQIVLTYTLTAMTVLLGLSTLWLSCGTLARDIEECQMQMVVVKPIARWQIWLGKWLGILSLNAALLLVGGASVYAVLLWRAGQLPDEQQRVLRQEVLVARGSARPADATPFIKEQTERILKDRLQRTGETAVQLAETRALIAGEITRRVQEVPSGATKFWVVDLGRTPAQLRGQPLFLRVKFSTAESGGLTPRSYIGFWRVGDPESGAYADIGPHSVAAETFHEFEVPSSVLSPEGRLTIAFLNRNDPATVFSLQDGVEVLYREGSFTANYVRGLGVILCWMALLAALGLAAASFLSFPVAAFVALASLTLVSCSGTIRSVVEEGTIAGYDSEHNTMGKSPADIVMVPLFKGVLTLIQFASDFNPIDALSTGRSVPWSELARAFAQVVLLLGGILAVFGIWAFDRRELAAAQGA